MAALRVVRHVRISHGCYHSNNRHEVLPSPFFSTSSPEEHIEEFRKFELMKTSTTRKAAVKRKMPKHQALPPRHLSLPLDQPWSDLWPTAQSFRPSVVPLPLHQGYVEKGAPPGKFANAELMKIPNFLHLTPPAIKLHCQAIKKFCTPWPEGLETDEDCEKNFPLEFISSDYCHAGPSIRDRRARIVTLKVKLSSLTLNYHARDKLLRLVGDRYDPATDILTIVNERCPVKQQNKDYAMYLLTALFHESWKVEPWEYEKTEADLEKFFWENSSAQKTVRNLIPQIKTVSQKEDIGELDYTEKLSQEHTNDDVENLKEVKDYAKCVTELINDGEDEVTLKKYKKAVLKLLNVKPSLLDSDVLESV